MDDQPQEYVSFLSGLIIDFNINQADYIPLELASGAGVRVTITHPSQSFSVRPKEDSYNAKPHTMTDFAIMMSQTIRQPEPYASKCWSTWDEYELFPDDIVNDVEKFTHDGHLLPVKSAADRSYSYSVS